MQLEVKCTCSIGEAKTSSAEMAPPTRMKQVCAYLEFPTINIDIFLAKKAYAEMSAGGDYRCCLCCPGLWVTRLRLVGAVVFGLWNNLSTLYNAKTLYESVSF